MTERDAAVRVKGVSHQFGEAGETQYVRALDDTSLDIARGELLCLIGPSGCGKSTLLNVIGGMMTPTSGAVECGGKPVRRPIRKTSAFVFRRTRCFPGTPCWKMFRLGMLFQGVPKSEHEARAKLSLEPSALPSSPTIIPASSPAACGSARRWRGRCR